MNVSPKIDNQMQPSVAISGVENSPQQNVAQTEVIVQPSRTIVSGSAEVSQQASKVPDKQIESRPVVISSVGADKSKRQDIKNVSRSERLEELKKCTTAAAKIIIGTVSLVVAGAGLLSVVKNANNIFHAVDGIFEAVTTAFANVAGRLTRKQSTQQSNLIGGVINEMKSMVCSDLNKNVTMEFLQSAGGKLCKKIDLSKLCDVATNASVLNEKFGINSYDQNALAGLKFQLLQCANNKKSNCKEFLDILNVIKNKYFSNECLEAVAANEIGKSTKLLDDKDLVKNSILYELITGASNIAEFFTQTKTIFIYVLMAIGIPAVGVFSKTFFNAIKNIYIFFKNGKV